MLCFLCRRRNEQLAAAEARHVDPLATNIEESERHLLASGQEVEAASMAPPDLALVQQRIKDIKALLENFKVGSASWRPNRDTACPRSACVHQGVHTSLLHSILRASSGTGSAAVHGLWVTLLCAASASGFCLASSSWSYSHQGPQMNTCCHSFHNND